MEARCLKLRANMRLAIGSASSRDARYNHWQETALTWDEQITAAFRRVGTADRSQRQCPCGTSTTKDVCGHSWTQTSRDMASITSESQSVVPVC